MPAPTSAFDRLRSLLGGVDPAPGRAPVDLHLGEPRFPLPPLPAGVLGDPDGWASYPPLGGTGELRAAYTGWLARRFGVRDALSGGRIAIEPTPGTKQAVSVAVMQAVARVGRGASVVLPDPYYPTYRAVTVASGARPHLISAAGDDIGAGTAQAVGPGTAAVVICRPGSPRGEVLSVAALRAVTEAAAASGATLVVDECYVDLGHGPAPVLGYLSLVERGLVDPGRFLVLHSLSKGSGAPGLRSGFAAGDPATVGEYAEYNRGCGVPTPRPVCVASAALWADDARVTSVRAATVRSWDLADEVLGGLAGYRRPAAGFFLWLWVGDDEETTVRLWHEHALRVMPGRYLSAVDSGGHDPGVGHVRVALVHPVEVMRDALIGVRGALSRQASAGGRGHPAPLVPGG